MDRQYVGIDFHRRRSVIVRVSTAGAGLDGCSDNHRERSVIGLGVVAVAPLDAPHSRDQPVDRRGVELVARLPNCRSGE
jgi:hypothetical protein